MHDNRYKFVMPPKSIVMSELSDIGVSNDLYYSRNLFAKSIFRGRIKCALSLVNPLGKTVLDVGCGAASWHTICQLMVLKLLLVT